MKDVKRNVSDPFGPYRETTMAWIRYLVIYLFVDFGLLMPAFCLANGGTSVSSVLTLRKLHTCSICPSYELTVYSDRRIQFVGLEDVHTIGETSGNIDASVLSQLNSRLAQLNAQPLRTSYPLFDHVTYRVTIYSGESQKTIALIPFSAPKSLQELIEFVEGNLLEKDWICPIPNDRSPYCDQLFNQSN